MLKNTQHETSRQLINARNKEGDKPANHTKSKIMNILIKIILNRETHLLYCDKI